jgi:hypothetical protein
MRSHTEQFEGSSARCKLSFRERQAGADWLDGEKRKVVCRRKKSHLQVASSDSLGIPGSGNFKSFVYKILKEEFQGFGCKQHTLSLLSQECCNRNSTEK